MPERLFLGDQPFVNNGLTLGDGGQAVVVEQAGMAVKILKSIEPDQLRKIQHLLQSPPSLPKRFIFPSVPLSTRPNGNGELRGYGMTKMPSTFKEMGVLFNSSLRKSLRIHTPTVLEILKIAGNDMDLIHANGMVLGDVSGRNAAFNFGRKGVDVYWYDTDSYQVAGIRCPVWTEYFLCPDLYPQTKTGRIKFSEESDMYGYWTILFWSLFNVHPYLQVHPRYLDFRERASNGIWYMSKGVQRTSLANHPDTITDDLLEQFERVFGKHKYDKFQVKLLDEYQSSLIECSSCGVYYPNTRRACPKCTIVTPAVDFQPTYYYESLVKTVGEIVFARFQSGNLYIISKEKSGYYLTLRPKGTKPVKVFIDIDLNGTFRFEMVGDEYLAINQIDTEMIYITSISAPGSEWIASSSEIYLGNRQTVFRGSEEGLIRQSGSKLLMGKVSNGRMLERVLPATVSKQETWMWSNARGDKIITLSRVFSKYHFQLIYKDRRFSLNQESLQTGDSLRDTAVFFGQDSVCLRRTINRKGKLVVLTEIFNLFGQSEFVSSHLLAKMPSGDVHRCAYEDGEMYWQTDDGLVVEDLRRNELRLIPKTDRLVQASDKLIHLGGRSHFLVIKEKQVNYLILT